MTTRTRSSTAHAISAVIMLGSVPAISAQVAARVDPAPVVRIGSADGEEHSLFDRVQGAVRLSTGEIVVADQGSSQIRWFSPGGKWIRTTGREGSGPGEYRGLGRLLLVPGDSVLAEDMLAARMTLYDRSGKLVRTWKITPAGAYVTPPPIGRLADGSLVAKTERALSQPPGHAKFVAILIRYRDGAIVDTLVTADGGESYTVPCGSGVCNMGVPYGVRSMATVAQDRIFVGNGDRYELIRLDTRTGRIDTLRRSAPATPLDAAQRRYYLDSLTTGIAADRAALIRDRLANAPVRRTLPFFDALLSDGAGRLWLARPQVRDATQRIWELLDLNGRFLGTVALPSGLRVMQIVGGHVVGIRRDADGVEFVEVYRTR